MEPRTGSASGTSYQNACLTSRNSPASYPKSVRATLDRSCSEWESYRRTADQARRSLAEPELSHPPPHVFFVLSNKKRSSARLLKPSASSLLWTSGARV